jgi:ubiquinone/menaquinone biosynthesis C-methylase UbiE
MNEFDYKAAAWDKNPMHLDRSEAIANEIKNLIPLRKDMAALEYGAGTGITSFLLKDYLKEITLIDNSSEMVKVMNEKIRITKVTNIKTLSLDLEHNNYEGEKFDLIFNQMVLHHVNDIENIISKFRKMLNPGGYLAIADLFPEDGTFHGAGFTGHKGFDPAELSQLILNQGFKNVSHKECFVINKVIYGNMTKHYNLFLLTANI